MISLAHFTLSYLFFQAMSIVTERLNANKGPAPADNPKTGKLAPGTVNNNKDLDVDPKKEEPSFFGSFFSANKGGAAAATKKKPGFTMEAVRFFSPGFHGRKTLIVCFVLIAPGCDSATGSFKRTRDHGNRSYQYVNSLVSKSSR